MTSECPNCRAVISGQSTICPGCHAPLFQPSHDPARPVFVWAFAVFNVLMAGWVVFYLLTGRTSVMAPRILNASFGGGDAAGVPVGGNFGLGYLVVLWIWGTVVLGLFAFPIWANGAKRGAGSRKPNGS
ncbi:hypothetical protein [Pelagibacterium limicola]|uniref:hypothetical protein n=1 Tax=Pelagibacterium limicola TaxID=2791022 RepID=UPI0018AF7787|nr:hypothetical protein [Pelagibacterium limicola]